MEAEAGVLVDVRKFNHQTDREKIRINGRTLFDLMIGKYLPVRYIPVETYPDMRRHLDLIRERPGGGPIKA